jgi:SAM-dependent methyltransferase
MGKMTEWDAIWSKPQITSDYSLKYLNFIRGIELPYDAKVIEVGCGTGQTLNMTCDTTGFDISLPALKIARYNCDHPIQGDIFHIPFKDNTFDLVYNSGVIEHFPEPTNAIAVNEMVRITKPGGTVIVIVPNSLCLWYRFGKFLASLLGRFEFGYEEDYTPDRLKKLFNQEVAVFGLQTLPPLATNDKELLPERIREKIGRIERYFPGKEWYAYTVGVIVKKRIN